MFSFQAIVRDLSHKGLGVVDHPDGRTFFARGVWPGDEGEFEAPTDLPKYSEVILKNLITPSPDRVPLACPHRGTLPGQCGGCPWMIANYSSQLSFKQKRLQHALEKRKIFLSNEIFRPMIASSKILGYRNRVQLKTNGKKLGYVSEGSSVFAPVEDCLIMNPKLNEIFQKLKETLPREDFSPSEGHQWCYVDLDDELSLSEVTPNRRRPFRQGNTEQNKKMREWVKENFSTLPRHYPVIDLFCGSGNFTKVLSEMGFSNILAVEVQGAALQELKAKNLPGVRILPLDMKHKGAWAMVAKLQPHAKAILLDPPREGLEKRRGLLKYLDNLEKIFYISCELDTFSRDISDLTRNGWRVEELTPIDLFPHTPHVEIMSILEKSRP